MSTNEAIEAVTGKKPPDLSLGMRTIHALVERFGWNPDVINDDVATLIESETGVKKLRSEVASYRKNCFDILAERDEVQEHAENLAEALDKCLELIGGETETFDRAMKVFAAYKEYQEKNA